MMQKSIDRFLKQTEYNDLGNIDEKYELIRTYWENIKNLFSEEWEDYRHNLITKGVGLYSLMLLLSDIVKNNTENKIAKGKYYDILKRLKGKIDWNSNGKFANAGGHKGALGVYSELKKVLGL